MDIASCGRRNVASKQAVAPFERLIKPPKPAHLSFSTRIGECLKLQAWRTEHAANWHSGVHAETRESTEIRRSVDGWEHSPRPHVLEDISPTWLSYSCCIVFSSCLIKSLDVLRCDHTGANFTASMLALCSTAFPVGYAGLFLDTTSGARKDLIF